MNIKTGNVIVGFIVGGVMGVTVITAIYTVVQKSRDKKNIVRICPDGTRIYRYSDGHYMAVGTGWGSSTETVPGPEICDK